MLLLVLLLPLLCVSSSPALPPSETSVLTLEPTSEHPRNSEGAFVALKSGRILYLYTQFYGGAADESAARIVSIYSDDDGRTWSSAARTIVAHESGANVMSVSLLRLQDGRIALFYLRKNSWLDCRPYVQFSSDEGETWSEARLIVSAPGYFVLNNDRVIQHTSGRILVPLAFHRSRGADPASSKSFDGRAIALWQFSDDAGATWKEAPQWLALAEPATHTGLQEPGIVESPDGSLLAWFRTDRGFQFESRSEDRGFRWSAPRPAALSSPASPASIKRIPGSNFLLGLWNDHSGAYAELGNKRTPLMAGISQDGGVSWSHLKLVEDDPAGWYCYTAIHFTRDAVLLAYCAGDSKIGGLNRLRIRRIETSWFSEQAKP